MSESANNEAQLKKALEMNGMLQKRASNLEKEIKNLKSTISSNEAVLKANKKTIECYNALIGRLKSSIESMKAVLPIGVDAKLDSDYNIEITNVNESPGLGLMWIPYILIIASEASIFSQMDKRRNSPTMVSAFTIGFVFELLMRGLSSLLLDYKVTQSALRYINQHGKLKVSAVLIKVAIKMTVAKVILGLTDEQDSTGDVLDKVLYIVNYYLGVDDFQDSFTWPILIMVHLDQLIEKIPIRY